MIRKSPYQAIGVLMPIIWLCFFCVPTEVNAQETDGKKLEVPKRGNPTKMDNKKVRTSKKVKVKGNPNKGNNKVIVVNPFKWDWNKVMWFKAKKSRYETKGYNPDKRPKRETYNNQPNYESTDRKAITNPSKLKKPLIPYDSRVAEEGPVLQKKRKPKNVNISSGGPQDIPTAIQLNDPSQTLSKAPKEVKKGKVDGKKLYSKASDRKRDPLNNSKLETVSAPDLEPKSDGDKIMFKKKKNDYPKMNNDKLMVAERPDYKSSKTDGDKLLTVDATNKMPKPFDNDKLMTERVIDRKKNHFDDSKLMTATPANRERKPFDNSKLMTEQVIDRKKNHFDDSKLMTATPANRERKPFDNSKLMTEQVIDRKKNHFDDSKLMTAVVRKPSKKPIHDDRLLVVPERKLHEAKMKELSKDISKESGDYQKYFYVTTDSHPGTKILAAENSKFPFFARTTQSISSFFTSIWKDDTQPKYVTRKKPKERRDKKEGKIWDNSVHPDEWRKQEAESGKQ